LLLCATYATLAIESVSGLLEGAAGLDIKLSCHIFIGCFVVVFCRGFLLTPGSVRLYPHDSVPLGHLPLILSFWRYQETCTAWIWSVPLGCRSGHLGPPAFWTCLRHRYVGKSFTQTPPAAAKIYLRGAVQTPPRSFVGSLLRCCHVGRLGFGWVAVFSFHTIFNCFFFFGFGHFFWGCLFGATFWFGPSDK